jgi:hypothetical protein
MGIFAYFVYSFLDVLLAVPLFLLHARESQPMEKRYPAHPLAFSMEPTNRLKKRRDLYNCRCTEKGGLIYRGRAHKNTKHEHFRRSLEHI